jgi:multiple RNA-binding domain-containing protein 1
VAKSDLLLTPDSSSTDPAVKAAMAETTILTETRTYLTDHGINLASLTSSQKDRSDTVIIAKNFPYGTTHDELVLLFGGTDTVKRILLPPAGTIAFIEFYDAGQARATFKRLAYRRFKDVPLYLEKAPKGIFEAEPTSKITGVEAKKGSSDVLSADTEEPGSTLYIKNLDFSTTQTGLTNAFKNFPGFRLAMLKVKPPNAKGEKLSMGFGFVTFQSKETASSAMNAGVILDGRKLEIKFARQGATEVKTSSTKPTAARKKIVVKNLGFSVTKKDLRELFGTYGHIQSLRLPKKFDNSLRGFAFIEFTTASDARNAMDSLKHTHLLGRHLVLEWAEEEVVTGLEKVRGKVIEGVQAGEVGKLMGLNSSGGRVGDILDEDE